MSTARLHGLRVVIELYPPKHERDTDVYYNAISPFDGHQTRSAAEMDAADVAQRLPWLLYEARIRGESVIYVDRDYMKEEPAS